MQAFDSLCHARPAASSLPIRWRNAGVRLEFVFAFVLLLANGPLFWGGSTELLAFNPARVAAGEWWRVITHPFVHVSAYHLLLDGAAFLMLCADLRRWSVVRRLAAIAACGLGSALAAMISPLLQAHGLSGLSGIAHGLMAITSLESVARGDSWERGIGWCSLAIVLIKAGVEAATGHALLSFLHFGLMGTPIAVCHAGGVLGGLLFYLLLSCRPLLHQIKGHTALLGSRAN
jgi:rhomboid family GlyGly-CTERM serine protease